MTRSIFIAVFMMVMTAAPTRAGEARSHVTGNFALDIEGGTGYLHDVDGGAISAEVIEHQVGNDSLDKKHLSHPEYESIDIQLGLSSSPAINDWIQASWEKKYQRKSGAISALDFKLRALSRWEFVEALITETTIPACDIAAKDPAFLRVKIACEKSRYRRGNGQVLPGLPAPGKQKQWLPSNFRLKIAGIDCSKVSKIDSITVKQTVTQDEIGELNRLVTMFLDFTDDQAQRRKRLHERAALVGRLKAVLGE